jgi:metallo-beta-lactamase class B
VASASSAEVLKAGGVAKDDPQYGDIRGLDAVANVTALKFEEPLKLGSLTMTPHSTPGHTEGGTTWTWQSCSGGACERMVYADSIMAVAGPGYKFSEHPETIEEFERSFAFLDSVPCDVLMTPHPEASNLLARAEAHSKGAVPDPLIDTTACHKLADAGRAQLKAQLASER